MQEKTRSKKPFILGSFAVLIIVVLALVVYAHHDKKQKEEIWAFRDTLDKTYFPVRDEFESCVYSNKTSKKYDCNELDILDRNQKVKERISHYEVSSEDAKKLKNEVLNGIDIIDKTAKDQDTSHELTSHKGKLSSEQMKRMLDNSAALEADEKDFYKNAHTVYKILVPKYYSKG